jgi:hypothetical protein
MSSTIFGGRVMTVVEAAGGRPPVLSPPGRAESRPFGPEDRHE